MCMRHLSQHPNSNWYRELDLPDRLLVFDTGGPFARVAARTIRLLAVNHIPEKDGFLTLVPQDDLGERILHDWGGYAVELHCADDISHSRVRPARNHMDATRTFCTGVKRLSLRLDFERVHSMSQLVEMHAERLESLIVSFKALRSFQLNLPLMPKLKTLEVRGPRLHDLSRVLENSCATLESVTLSGTHTKWKRIIDALYKCEKLAVVELCGRVPEEEYAAYLQSRGLRLELATMDEMDDRLCERVMQACPNLRCDLAVAATDLSRITLLGPRVRQMNIRYLTVSNRVEGMEVAAAKCSNITEFVCVSSNEGDGGVMVQIFMTPKPKLERLKLLLSRSIVSNRLMQQLCKSTGNLRSLSITTGMYERYSGLITLLEVNPKLETVEVTELRELKEEWGVEKVRKIFRVLRGHQFLKKVCISLTMTRSDRGIARMANECVPFRNRRIEVSVGAMTFC